MLRNIVCLAFALTLVSAVEEDVADAQETIKLMMSQGADANACKELAENSIKDVKTALSNNQEQLDKMTTGSTCVAQADVDAGVSAAEQAAATAVKDLTAAQGTLAIAENVIPGNIIIPTVRTLSQNSGKTCDWAYPSSFATAKDAMVAAETAVNTATTTVAKTKTSLESAKETAAKQAKKCLCDVVAASDTAWTTVSAAGPADDRATSWTKSYNILCALSGTSPCIVPAVPEVKRPAFVPDTAAVAEQCRNEAAKEISDKNERKRQLTAGINWGCYADKSDRDLPFDNRNNDIGHDDCANRCRSKGYKFMGRQFHRQCFCGNNDPGKYGKSGSCGDVKNNCEIRDSKYYGDWTNCVYQIRE